MNSTIMRMQALRNWYRPLTPQARLVSGFGLAASLLVALASAGCSGDEASSSQYGPVAPAPYYGPMVPGSQANGDNFWSSGFGAGNHDQGNRTGYVSVPGVGPVGYGR